MAEQKGDKEEVFFPFAALKVPIMCNLALLILEKNIGEG